MMKKTTSFLPVWLLLPTLFYILLSAISLFALPDVRKFLNTLLFAAITCGLLAVGFYWYFQKRLRDIYREALKYFGESGYMEVAQRTEEIAQVRKLAREWKRKAKERGDPLLLPTEFRRQLKQARTLVHSCEVEMKRWNTLLQEDCMQNGVTMEEVMIRMKKDGWPLLQELPPDEDEGKVDFKA